MTSKAGIITAAVFAILGILAVCVVCGAIAWAGGCNIAGVTFNYEDARDVMPCMIGNAFWGWFVCPVGLTMIGLLGYVIYRICMYTRYKVRGYDKIESDEEVPLLQAEQSAEANE